MTTGSAQLVEELQLYFGAVARDLKRKRECLDEETEVIHDEKTFDMAMKLLGGVDKIKKMDAVEPVSPTDGTPKPTTPVRNIQDILLQKV